MRGLRLFERPRFSLRTLLIATALVGLLLGVVEWRVFQPYRTATELDRMPGVSVMLSGYPTRFFMRIDANALRAHDEAVGSPWTYWTKSVAQVDVRCEDVRGVDVARLKFLLRNLPALHTLTIWNGDREFFHNLGPGISTEHLNIIKPADSDEAVRSAANFRKATGLFLRDVRITPESVRPLRGSSVETLRFRTNDPVDDFKAVHLAIQAAIPEIPVDGP